MNNVRGWLIWQEHGDWITNKPRGFGGASALSDVEVVLAGKHGLEMVIEIDSNIKYLCDRGRVQWEIQNVVFSFFNFHFKIKI